jgi:hypothetical protein
LLGAVFFFVELLEPALLAPRLHLEGGRADGGEKSAVERRRRRNEGEENDASLLLKSVAVSGM